MTINNILTKMTFCLDILDLVIWDCIQNDSCIPENVLKDIFYSFTWQTVSKQFFLKDGVLWPSWIWSSQCKNTYIIGFLIPGHLLNDIVQHSVTFFLEKLGFPRWHLAAILNMVIPGRQNAKLLAEMDSSYQKTSKTTYCTIFCDTDLKS